MDFSIEYLAGLFDGEGCVHIGRRPRGIWLPSFFLQVNISMAHSGLVHAVADQIGGYVTINRHDLVRPGRRAAYQLGLNGTPSRLFLQDLYPYLRIKKEEARVAIVFQTHMETYRYQARHMSKEELDAIIAYRERIRLYVKGCKKRLIYGATDWDVGEFGGYPMPGPEMDAEGQYRAEQGLAISSVCNEHVPTPKGKICSALTGDSEMAAEMTATYRRRPRLCLVE